MTDRANLRKNLGLTQTIAARRARVSLATWRRWESDPSNVATETAELCERVLSVQPLRLASDDELFERQWAKYPQVTPRQAFAVVIALSLWADELDTWLKDPTEEPLHDVGPFARFDRRVMFYVGESRAFAAETRDRCVAVVAEIEDGTMPFMRQGMFMDDVLLGAALDAARDHLQDMPELFEAISTRTGDGDDEISDEDWDAFRDWIDDEANAADWELPLGWPMLPLLLQARHPFTWFDVHRDPPSYSLHRAPADRLPSEEDL